jgi:CBS domain-containing protein
VHRRLGNRYLAAVDEEVADHLEGIVRALTRGKDVYSVFQRAVTVTEVDAPVGEALTVMSRLSLSQLPVYRNRVFVDLLTADTVARWLGANVHDELADLTVPVREVLRHKEGLEKYAFISRDESLFEVIEAFDRHTHRGERLSALLITQQGRETETLLGIVTAYDLPRAFEAAGE